SARGPGGRRARRPRGRRRGRRLRQARVGNAPRARRLRGLRDLLQAPWAKEEHVDVDADEERDDEPEPGRAAELLTDHVRRATPSGHTWVSSQFFAGGKKLVDSPLSTAPQHLVRMRPRARRDLQASRHSGNFFAALGLIEALDRRLDAAVALGLLDAEVAVGERGDLRQVRHADDLPAVGDAADLLPDHLGGGAADAGVDLVEDVGRHRIRLPEGELEREDDARELAARRHLGERTQLLAPVGAEEELDAIPAARAELAPLPRFPRLPRLPRLPR